MQNKGIDFTTLNVNETTELKISDVIPSISKRDESKYWVYKGQLIYIGRDQDEINWCKQLEIKVLADVSDEMEEEIASINIFNPEAVVLNKTVDYSGNIIDSNQIISQTFGVKEGETAITLSYVNSSGTHQLQSFVVTFFDSSMNMLQQKSGTTHNIPENAEYFIINIGDIFAERLDKIMVQYGTVMTDFEAYLDENIKKKITITT